MANTEESGSWIKPGKKLPNEVRSSIIELYTAGQSIREIADFWHISPQTVRNIVKLYSDTGSIDSRRGEHLESVLSEGIGTRLEYYKSIKPSIHAKEIQSKLVEDGFCFQNMTPSVSSINTFYRKKLGYSYKKITKVPQVHVQNRFDQFVANLSNVPAANIHCFDEASVIQTTTNRDYGHAPKNKRAFEIQRYASNATRTVNLLHGLFGVDAFNIVNGPSNGLEMLTFFQFALQQTDRFGNHKIKQGDVIIMDNYGFHHGRFAEQR